MFTNTTIYQKSLELAGEILKNFKGDDVLAQRIKKEALEMPVNILHALSQPKEHNFSLLKAAVANIYSLLPLLELAGRKGQGRKLLDFKTELEDFPTGRKKILILTIRTGEGHRTAAFATREGIEALYGKDYDVEVIDFVETMNLLVGKTSERGYNQSIKYFPSVYKFIYETFDKEWRIKLVNYLNYPLLYTKLNRLLLEKNPDLIVSTNPLWDFSVRQIWKKHHKEAKFVSIVTDSITVHHAWVTAETDFYIVSNEDTAESLRKLQVDNAKIKVLGFPLSLKFERKVNRASFLRNMRLDPDLFTILYIVNTGGTRRSVGIMKKISAGLKDVQVMVITGKNVNLLERFLELKLSLPYRVFGWVDNMHEFMQAADVVITKAGGASVMECIAAGKPMIIPQVIAGQEEGNARLIGKHHLGYVVRTPAEIVKAISAIRKERSGIKKNLAKLAYPNAARDVARFVVGLLGDK